MLPSRIGRYEVLGQLAAGGMAEILLARLSGPADFKRAVVIKRILRSYASNESFVRMFLDEARIIASLRHPNIVHVQELGEQDGEAFLVMEYVAGENVASLVKRSIGTSSPLDPRFAAHIVAEMCAGLHAAHELTDDEGRPQNLVHRDVSPQNVLVGYDGHVKLVDFGVALVDRRATRTEPGEVKGKLEYMSPEQGLGRALDRRSDIFSAGIVLYELSTGRRLFKRPSIARSIEAICREPVAPPSRAVPSGAPPFPPKLDAIVMRALAKNPDDRYATAAEMRRELLEVAREIASPVEALAERMKDLFADRITEKRELVQKVGAGEDLARIPAGETDDNVEVPAAPVAAPATARPWKTLAAVSIALAAAIAAATLVLRPPPPTRTAAPDPPEVAPTPALVSVRVESNPPGARVFIGQNDEGETPTTLHLPRGSAPLTIEVRRQGYTTATQELTPDNDQKLLVGLVPIAPSPPVLSASTSKPAVRPTAKHPAPPASAGFRRFD